MTEKKWPHEFSGSKVVERRVKKGSTLVGEGAVKKVVNSSTR